MMYWQIRKKRLWKSEMTNSNFIVKATDTKVTDIQKALQAAGIKVRSIIEVFREEDGAKEEEKKEA